ncbi:MAG: glycosyl transferase family 2 [Bacteroidetes bacterium]|nr:glycosyl transferase family 2 [Bacteroidota bacterium]
MIILSLIIIFGYALLIASFIRGWISLPEYKVTDVRKGPRVTIIAPCKNELKHLSNLLGAIKDQTYREFELILIDDGSTDGSWEFASQFASGFPELKQIRNEGTGKKNAIKTAVLKSENELIVTLDADCIPPSGWLNAIVQFYQEKTSDLIICPVNMNSDGSFFQEFQQFEFVSLIASGAGAAAINMPILCNGANLAFRREVWLRNMDRLHFEVPGGDDIFLLQSVKKRKGIIRFLKSREATVITQSSDSLKSFINQRRRWASKKSAYADWQLTLTALVIFMACFIILFNLFIAVMHPQYLLLACVLFLFKLLTDISMFHVVGEFFGLKRVVVNAFLFSLIYPFYIVFTALISLFNHKKGW